MIGSTMTNPMVSLGELKTGKLLEGRDFKWVPVQGGGSVSIRSGALVDGAVFELKVQSERGTFEPKQFKLNNGTLYPLQKIDDGGLTGPQLDTFSVR